MGNGLFRNEVLPFSQEGQKSYVSPQPSASSERDKLGAHLHAPVSEGGPRQQFLRAVQGSGSRGLNDSPQGACGDSESCAVT